MKWIRKPVVVDAQCWDGTPDAVDAIERMLPEPTDFQVLDSVWMDSPDATAICRSGWRGGAWVAMYTGDYVVVDDSGVAFPLNRAVFEETYERLGNG